MNCQMSLSQLSALCDGQLHGQDLDFDAVSIDSRLVAQNELYVGIDGERFKGFEFAQDAVNAGAKAVVGTQQVEGLPVSQVIVPDATQALSQIAGKCRGQFKKPVIAITGSAGKTTTRKMLGDILSVSHSVCMTEGNQNNEVGVPLTLLRLDKAHDVAVVEMGARHLGDIAHLCEFTKPDVSVLLNAGSAHVGEFGGYDAIVQTKGEIFEALGGAGVAILNLDDAANDVWRQKIGARRIVSFSAEGCAQADVQGKNIKADANGVAFTLTYDGDIAEVSMPVLGAHNVSNALAAAAAAIAINVSLNDVVIGLERYRPESGRLELLNLANGLTFVNDSYNANPASTKGALTVLDKMPGKRIAVLGEMGELGEQALDMHCDVARFAASLGIEEFWILGPFATEMQSCIGERALTFESKRDIVNKLVSEQNTQLSVLLKASRSVALEQVVSDYIERADTCFIG